MENNGWNDVRLFYTKTGTAKYISHLDVMRAFQRAFKRSGIELWYTEGFHPHLYLTFTLPLSLGYESMAESVDFRIMKPIPYDEIVETFNKALPPGFQALSAGPIVMSPHDIKYADYEVSFKVSAGKPEEVLRAWDECFSAQQVNVKKKTKHLDKIIDIKPLIVLSELRADGDRFSLEMRLSAGTLQNINPNLLFEAFASSSGMVAEELSVLRRAVYNEKGEIFC